MGGGNVHHKDIPLQERIIFALDVDSEDLAREWVERLEGAVRFYKVGLQLFLAGWFRIVDWIIGRGHRVMVDLKFFDVPETVRLAVRQLNDRGITFATVHGNDAMLRAAAREKSDLKILAVTVLTSLDQSDLNELGFTCSVEELVFSRARRALELGCDGVVSSGMEARRLRNQLGDNLLIVVPGVRPVENRQQDDQKRIITVRSAFQDGADHVVIGRPIRNAADPLALVADLQRDIAEALKYS
jgi:orotidine-5'-phosphate decarboxylase